MRLDKNLAIELRRQYKSYNEISAILKIPKSTLATWFSMEKFSIKTKQTLTKQMLSDSERIKKFVTSNTLRWEQWRSSARNDAKQEFQRLIKNPLFISGLMLYWAEGDSKLKNPVRFTNTDPRMIALYTKFLIKTLNVPKKKLRATIIIYPDLQENKCVSFWSNVTDLPRSQFYKTQFIKGKHPTARLSNGICMIMFSDRQLKEKITIWIDLLSKKL